MHSVGNRRESPEKSWKKLDDENVLVEVQLLESKTYHALSYLPKAAKNRSLAEFQV